jgi:cyclopropane fatty-acyl-phospholipid synthase-like methyltransferase
MSSTRDENVDASARQARYSALRWNTPLAEAHAELLIRHLRVAAGSSVLDLGCGWGELLARVVASDASGQATGIGVDTDAGQLARGRIALSECGLEERVSLVDASARGWSQPAERVICIGASHAWGGTKEALAALAQAVVPGGRLLFGDGCWEGSVTPEAATIFPGVLPLREIIESVQAAGWRTLHLSTASQREWDDFESSWRLGSEEWLLANPSVAAASELRRELDQRLLEYVGAYRRVLGFCYLVLTR